MPRPLPGRYALHAEACAAKDIFLALNADRIDLPGFSCTGLTFKAEKSSGDRALWAVAGQHCVGEEGAPVPRRFRLEARGTSLRVLWPDGALSAPLMRCGR